MSEQYPPQYPGQYPSQYPNQNPPQSSYPGGEMYPPPPPPPSYQQPYQQQPSGYAPPPQYPAGAAYAPYAPVPVAGSSKLAIASLICGIVGLCTGFVGIGAVICGHLALNEIKKSGNVLQGRGMAIAGLILGYLELAFIIVYILVIAIASASGGPA